MVFVSLIIFSTLVSVCVLSPTVSCIICSLWSVSFLTWLSFVLLKCSDSALFSIIFLQWLEVCHKKCADNAFIVLQVVVPFCRLTYALYLR